MDDSALAWLPRFLSHLTVERRLSAHTDTNYKRDLQRFVAEPVVERLLAAAESDATTPMRPSGRGTLVIRSISAKQRPRRKGAQ